MSRRAEKRQIGRMLHERGKALTTKQEIAKVLAYVRDEVSNRSPRKAQLLDDLECLSETLQADIEHAEAAIDEFVQAIPEQHRPRWWSIDRLQWRRGA